MKPIRRRRRAQVVVVLALAAVACLSAIGLSVDAGNAFLHRRATQNMADLAALAATKVIVNDLVGDAAANGNAVVNAISGSLDDNGCAAVACSWSGSYVAADPLQPQLQTLSAISAGTLPNGVMGVSLSVSQRTPAYFLRLLGRDHWDISADASAIASVPVQLPGSTVLPIGIFPPNTGFTSGQTITLTQGTAAPGNFGWLTWTGDQSATALATSVCTPDNPTLALPAWVDGNTGVVNSTDVRDCLETWRGNGTVVLVPTWDVVTGTGSNAQFRLTGFCALQIQSYAQPSIDRITATFIEYYPLPAVPAGYGRAPTPDDTSYFLGLVR